MHFMPRQHRSLYVLIAAVLFIHTITLIVQIKDKFEISQWDRPASKVIKLKLVEEAIKDMASIKNKKQIVQSEDAPTREKPKEAAFLSDKDRQFDRQTMARKVDIFKNVAQGDASHNQVAEQKKSVKSKSKPSLKNLKFSDIGIAPNEPIAETIQRNPSHVAKQGIKSGDPKHQGLSSTNDYVEEVKLGDFTHLNTVEYKFYGFFHRIRQKLEQFWGNSIQEKAANLFRAGRRLPASENLITSLQVTLNENGEIIHVKIVGESGVKELDDAAIESFNQAGPFPNPPKDLLVNGKAVIEWGFVVKS